MRAAALAVLFCLALGLAACGGGGDKSDEDQVRDIAKLIATSDEGVCDKVTDALLKKSFGGKKSTCQKSAKENNASGTVGAVTIDGDNASAVVKDDGDETTFKFVKRDGDWKADDFESGSASSGSSDTATAETTTAPTSAAEGEVAARGAADAFLAAVQSDDEAVICGLLQEGYAQELTGKADFAIAECVNQLKGKSLAGLKSKLAGVKSGAVTLTGDGSSGGVRLTNGNVLELQKDGQRYVISGIGK